MNIFKNIIIATLVLIVWNIQAQSDEALKTSPGIIGRGLGDAIQLRWGPGSAPIWELAIKQGYIVERALYQGEAVPIESLNFQRLRESPFLPWNEDQWVTYFNAHPEETKEKEYMGLAYLFNFDDQPVEPNQQSTSIFEDGLNSLMEHKNRLDTKYGFSMLAAARNFGVAQALGIGYVDREVEPGKTYVYRVSLNGESPMYQVEPDYLVQGTAPFDASKFSQEILVEEKDQKILMNWEKLDQFLAFTIDRSDDGKQSFRSLNEVPYTNTRPKGLEKRPLEGYLDKKDLENYQTYYYRIYGHTAFGDSILMGEVKAMPRDRTPPGKPILKNPKHIDPNTVLLKWEVYEPIAQDLWGFRVSRAKDEEGPFTPITENILDEAERTFYDKTFDKEGSNYYLVEAVDTAGNASPSNTGYVTLVDSIPPAIPEFLSGVMDSFGIVTLELKPNMERDLMGYRLLKSNAEDHEYSVFYETYAYDNDSLAKATIIKDTSTLNTLTGAIYYRAAALDDHYNSSAMSIPLKVVRPDTIRPVTPLFKKYMVKEESVELTFVPSTSDDVIRHLLFRRLEGETTWGTIAELGPQDSLYTDSLVQSNTTYEYALQAIDDDQLKSDISRSIIARPYLLNPVPPVNDLLAVLDSEKKSVSLSWSYDPGNLEDYFFVLFKKEEGSPMRSLTKIRQGESFQFVDNKIDEAVSNYAYRIKVFSKIGESKPSPVVIAELK